MHTFFLKKRLHSISRAMSDSNKPKRSLDVELCTPTTQLRDLHSHLLGWFHLHLRWPTHAILASLNHPQLALSVPTVVMVFFCFFLRIDVRPFMELRIQTRRGVVPRTLSIPLYERKHSSSRPYRIERYRSDTVVVRKCRSMSRHSHHQKRKAASSSSPYGYYTHPGARPQ
ncbi:hypothetical protein FKP32DRAFT_1595702 [Trametes sanguinea]|nr:hypothetical protein FKP32DRAFT_1595702 [Trametes sanguinea]